MKGALSSLLLAALGVASCAPLQRADLNSARSRWNAAHLTHYRYTLNEAPCLCQYYELAPLSIEVRTDGTISIVDKDGTPLTDDEKRVFQEYVPISRMFDDVEQMIGHVYQLDVATIGSMAFQAG